MYRVTQPIEAYARLIGTWEVEGDVIGTDSFQWLPGGFFIVERVSLVQRGRPLETLAVIGQSRGWRGAPSPDVTARAYDSEGNSIDAVYELQGDRLTIWIEQRGSDTVYEAEFDEGWTVRRGRWTYPSGTTVESLARKVSASPGFDPLLAHELAKAEVAERVIPEGLR